MTRVRVSYAIKCESSLRTGAGDATLLFPVNLQITSICQRINKKEREKKEARIRKEKRMHETTVVVVVVDASRHAEIE